MQECWAEPEGETVLEMGFIKVNKPAHILADKAVMQGRGKGLAGSKH
jgi:hypothetical protein